MEDIDQIHFERNKIYPGCLPKGNFQKEEDAQLGIHSGWSTPPPLSYLQDNAPFHLPYYRDFRKQWHYRMDLVHCEDPSENEINGLPLQFPSKTFYPPGLICAKEQRRYFCPSSGESGSPLMTEDKDGNLVMEGFLSFIKGCGAFSFDQSFGSLWPLISLFDPEEFGLEYSVLFQLSNNPSAYTRLSCFLPWVAAQYNLQYEAPPQLDAECSVGSGVEDEDQEASATDCRSNPSSYFQSSSPAFLEEFDIDGNEFPCIFPFYLDGQKIDNLCIQLGEILFA